MLGNYHVGAEESQGRESCWQLPDKLFLEAAAHKTNHKLPSIAEVPPHPMFPRSQGLDNLRALGGAERPPPTLRQYALEFSSRAAGVRVSCNVMSYSQRRILSGEVLVEVTFASVISCLQAQDWL